MNWRIPQGYSNFQIPGCKDLFSFWTVKSLGEMLHGFSPKATALENELFNSCFTEYAHEICNVFFSLNQPPLKISMH